MTLADRSGGAPEEQADTTQGADGQPRSVSPATQGDDDQQDTRLRPARLRDFVGQPQVRENLSIAMEAARIRGEPLDHVVIYGPPGLGKTTLANIIAHEMGASLKVTSGPAVERASDIASILTGLQPNDVLFIDEIHRLNRAVEEVMYSAMEDYFLSWVVGKGLSARNINLRINPFTLVGATTRYSLISAPLRDRFGSVFRLDYYSDEDMETVVKRSSGIMGMDAEDEGLREVAVRSRGTPRIANRLLRRARDYALVKFDNRITGPVARESLEPIGCGLQGSGRNRPSSADQHHPQIQRRAGGTGHAGGVAERGYQHGDGSPGTVPVAAGLPGTDAAGQNRDAAGLRVFGLALVGVRRRPEAAGAAVPVGTLPFQHDDDFTSSLHNHDTTSNALRYDNY